VTPSFADHANSFDRAADLYERARPSYPADAVDWLLESNPEVSLELGAGTGKFTRLIADRTRVIATDPSRNMLEQIPVDVERRVGTAENIPLREGSVDAVYAAQAWHWVDPTTAVPEVARVLRTGGILGLIWNGRDDRVDWVAKLSEIIVDSPAEELKGFADVEGLAPVERFETAWSHELDRDEIAELVASRSYFILQDAAAQAATLEQVRRLLDTHPDTRDLQRIPVPYRTFAFRARLRPVP